MRTHDQSPKAFREHLFSVQVAPRLRRRGKHVAQDGPARDRLAVDRRDLRGRFVEQPRKTLANLHDQGYELAPEELEAILLCDPTLWVSSADKIHPRLRRARLH